MTACLFVLFERFELILVLQGPRTCLPGERAALKEVGGRQLVSVQLPALHNVQFVKYDGPVVKS